MVGGIVAGLVTVAVIVGALLYFCRNRPSTSVEFDAQPSLSSPDSQPPPPDMVHAPVSPSLYSTTLFSNYLSNDNPLSQNSIPSPSSDIFPPTNITDSGNDRHSAISPQGKDPNGAGDTLSSRTDSHNDGNRSNRLTGEQAAYVQNMYSLNVPVPGIAVVVERMLQEGEIIGENSAGDVDVRRANTTVTMPPHYEDI